MVVRPTSVFAAVQAGNAANKFDDTAHDQREAGREHEADPGLVLEGLAPSAPMKNA